MTGSLRVAAVQMNSQADKAANMARADRLVRESVAGGANVVLLPEKFNVMGSSADYRANAEPLDGPTVTWARELARELAIDLVAGSIVERVEGREKLANTCVHAGPDGEIKAVYRKIHMFDVEVGGQVYRESDHEQRGDEIVDTALAGDLPAGLTVCYDLRFPELYRILAVRGTLVQFVPAAFTYVTGEAHWELLLRARAVENQVFIAAADQCGYHDGDRRSYGNSMIVDPWGTVLARAGDDDETVISAALDIAAQSAIRDKLPALANRVPQAYSW
ncbi:MAG: carbon-nitrogen hydrolase family protein [Actinobacteria bacterium]|nr:carbon-nitrogen hydrolase family protein [Actinomycetota bacterium]